MHIGKNPDLKECPHAPAGAVHCDPNKHSCVNCGWDPEVAKARLRARGIYPSVEELPTFGSFYGQVLYVSEDKKIYPYTWEGNRWERKKD